MNDRVVKLPVNGAKLSFQGGMYSMRTMIDPSLLPLVCPGCGDPGTRKEALYFRDPIPRSLWLTLKWVFFGLLLLIALGALLTWIMWGVKAINDYLTGTVIIVVVVVVGAGVRIGRSAFRRSQWGLTFYFCEPCARRYRTLKKGLTVVGTLAAVSFLIWPPLAFLVLLTGSLIELNWLGILILASFPVFLVGTVAIYVVMKRTRGITAKWVSGQSAVEIEFRDLLLADIIRRWMSSEELVV